MGLPIVLISLLTACGGDDDASSESLDASAATQPASADSGDDVLTDGAEPVAATAENQSTVGAPGSADFDLGQIGRDVIVEMHVSMRSDDLARTVASITAQAAALGGGVASSDIDYGTLVEPERSEEEPSASVRGSDGFAVLVVKVPPGSVDNLLDGLADSGTVMAINQSATDVTDQLVNLDVRIENARTSVENVRGFMEATTNLNELVSLESELTRRQTELEQLEAQQRNLSDRVALSTLTIEVRPTPVTAVALDEPAASEGIADAFRTGWEAFVGVLFGVGFILAVLAPFLALGLVVAGLAWMISRRTRREASGSGGILSDPAASIEHDQDDAEVVTSSHPG